MGRVARRSTLQALVRRAVPGKSVTILWRPVAVARATRLTSNAVPQSTFSRLLQFFTHAAADDPDDYPSGPMRLAWYVRLRFQRNPSMLPFAIVNDTMPPYIRSRTRVRVNK
jgi:hypothetical protein